MSKLKVAICGNEIEDDDLLWVKACEDFSDQVDYERINLTKADWLERIEQVNADWYLLKPGGFTSHFKQLYDERVLVMEGLGLKMFPNRNEVFIYENKRYLSFWLKANRIPHPATDVLYYKEEALSFVKNSTFPLVGKTNIGASGAGIQILKSLEQAEKYVVDVFSGKGAQKRVGPNMKKGGLIKRGLNLLFNPKLLKKRLSIYKSLSGEAQTQFLIFQEFIPHDFEWRVVRIGDNFFAHKKLKLGEKASGSLEKNYDDPPLDLLTFAKEITDRFGLYSQAVDVFESDRGYLVNEMQCIFGQSDAYQMKVGGKVGRYTWQDDSWLFEEGDFNQNASFNLRVLHVLNQGK